MGVVDLVVKDKNTKAIQIKRQLAGQLPNYKIPRIIRFVDHYERITLHNLEEMPNRADVILQLTANHEIESAEGL